jgi:class 3 adenylate cyclase
LTIELDGVERDPPASRRARSLLAWLIIERRMHARSRLAAQFWPDVLDESARTSLRSALVALRRAIGPDSERYLLATRDEVGLADESLVWTDLSEFNRCVQDGRLQDALKVAQGELLSGLDDDWVYERRDEQRIRLAGILSELAAGAEQAGNLRLAIDYTRRQAALDPLAEEPHRELMRRLTNAGDRSGALRLYERLSQRLRDELRITPSQQTRELARSLRTAAGEAPVAEPDPRPTSAAAVVTLLFTDLVGSTELLGNLGDDEAERLRRVHFGLLREVAATHGGREVKNLGDGLMVAFPSAVSAVSCAIGIQQAVQRHNVRDPDKRLDVRVGLNVGEPIRDQDDYFGTPVVVAKRLCDSARGGQILASELLRALVGSRGGFAFRSCGLVSLKGIRDPLAACEVVWEPAAARALPLPSALVTAGAPPLAGRDAELEALRRFRQQRDGQAGAVMLSGEPGIGKTRLAAEFCGAAHATGALVLLGRCQEESLLPYQPFVEALRHYVSETPLDTLVLQIGRHRPALARLVPELDPAGSSLPLPSPAESAERERLQLFEAVAALLRAIAHEKPLILMLDDLQWADAATVHLIRHIIRAAEGTSLLLLGTYRETEVDAAHPLQPALADLRRSRSLQTIALGGLGEHAVAALISAHAGPGTPADAVRTIIDRTQGNPFFVEELLRDARAQESFSHALTRIPDSVTDLLARRLRRLDEVAKRLLTYAAVCGGEFTLEVLRQASGESAELIAESLEMAIAAHIVEESADAIGRYSFVHALIRETIYQQLSLTRRAQLHRQVGDAIEALFGEQAEQQAAALAYHATAAGELAKAYRFHAQAADAAMRVYAAQSALTHYSAAIDAAGQLGVRANRDPELRRLLLERAQLRFRTGALDASIGEFEALLDAARQADDRATEMEVLNHIGLAHLRHDLDSSARFHEAALALADQLGDTVAQTSALGRLSVVCSHLLQFDQALERGERALELARRSGQELLIGRAMDSIKLAAWQLGDLQRLDELTLRLTRLWRERGDLWYLQFTLQESAFVPIGHALWNDAAARLEDAAVINRRIHDPGAEVLILDALCWLHRSQGSYDKALAAGRQAVALTAEGPWLAWAAATLGGTLLEIGAADRAATVLDRGVAFSEHTGALNDLVRCHGHLAWAWLQQGDEDLARVHAAAAEELFERVSGPPGSAFLFGMPACAATARVLLATGAPERGAQLLSPAVAAAERSGWFEAIASGQLVLGLCLARCGELAAARAALTRAADVAEQRGIPGPGWEAHASLAELSVDRERNATAARAILDRLISGLADSADREALRERARL